MAQEITNQQMPSNLLPAALSVASASANGSYNGDDAFGLTRPIPRPYHKATFVFKANASGNWEPQQSTTAAIIVFQHGINDTFTANTNPFAQAGISGQPATRSVEFTNSQYNGGFSMTLQALLLSVGIVQERIRYGTVAASVWAVLSGTTPGIAPRGAATAATGTGGIVGDNEFNLQDRLLMSVLGASEWQLLPYANNTACPLFLGIPQLMTNRVSGETGGPNASMDAPSFQWRFRDDILVNPGIQGTTVQPNQLQLSWLSGVLASVEKITGSASKTADTTLLALDVVIVVDVAFGLMRPVGAVRLPDGSYNTTPVFQFATEFDARKYDCYRSAV